MGHRGRPQITERRPPSSRGPSGKHVPQDELSVSEGISWETSNLRKASSELVQTPSFPALLGIRPPMVAGMSWETLNQRKAFSEPEWTSLESTFHEMDFIRWCVVGDLESARGVLRARDFSELEKKAGQSGRRPGKGREKAWKRLGKGGHHEAAAARGIVGDSKRRKSVLRPLVEYALENMRLSLPRGSLP